MKLFGETANIYHVFLKAICHQYTSLIEGNTLQTPRPSKM